MDLELPSRSAARGLPYPCEVGEPMTTLTTCVPASHPGDSGDVAAALEIAASLWRKGSHRDAIRWVRRAAQAADESGDSRRMSALSRASADLEASLTAAPSVRSSTPPPLP